MSSQQANSGRVIWLTGLSGSGKSTLADALSNYLRSNAVKVYRLDGDTLRGGLNADLGFGAEDRNENLRRAAHVARLFALEGYTVVASFITPLEQQRQHIRDQFSDVFYQEVALTTPLAVCERRDPKGLYRKARQGLIPEFTGIDSPFEYAEGADVKLDTSRASLGECVARVVSELSLLDFRLPAIRQAG